MSERPTSPTQPRDGLRMGIMQPYFMPYIGYFQLIASVDVFVVYDNIKYTKRGWINRNRMLRDGEPAVFSLPVKGASDFLDICDREVASNFRPERLLNEFAAAYRRAPQFTQTISLIEGIVRFDDRNLFRFLEHSLVRTCEHLGISTEIRRSSDLIIDHSLKGQDRVLALCGAGGASTYVNPIGGVELYSRDAFRSRGIDLQFIRSKPFEYTQLGAGFVPSLSIIDVMMFNSPGAIRECLRTNYELV